MTTLEAQLLLKRSLSNTLPEQVQFGELIILGGGSQLAIVNSDNETATYLKPYPQVYQVNDENYTIPPDADTVLVHGLTATRTLTLPAGSEVYSGKRIVVRDASGLAWFGMPIVVQRAGADLINGYTKTYIEFPYDELIFTYDTSGSWSCREAPARRQDSWYLEDTFGYQSNSGSGYFAQVSGSGLTFTANSATDGGGPCVQGSLNTASTSRGSTSLFAGNSMLQFGGGAWYAEVLMNITSAVMGSNDGRLIIGMHNGASNSANAKPSNGIYAMHDPALSPYWIYGAVANSVRTEVVSNIPVSNSSFIRVAVKATPGSAQIAINRAVLGSVSTNLPSGSGQKCNLCAWAGRNNVNTASGAFVFNLFNFRLLFLPTNLRN